MLKRHEYFGQYGKVVKVVAHRNHVPATDTRPAAAAAYITFENTGSARDAIQGCDGFHLEGRVLHCSFGTSKCVRATSGVVCVCVCVWEGGGADQSWCDGCLVACTVRMVVSVC